MNQTRQFIEVFVHCRLHKLSVQCGPQKILYFDWFWFKNRKIFVGILWV